MPNNYSTYTVIPHADSCKKCSKVFNDEEEPHGLMTTDGSKCLVCVDCYEPYVKKMVAMFGKWIAWEGCLKTSNGIYINRCAVWCENFSHLVYAMDDK